MHADVHFYFRTAILIVRVFQYNFQNHFNIIATTLGISQFRNNSTLIYHQNLNKSKKATLSNNH